MTMNGDPVQLSPRLTAHEWVREHLRQSIISGSFPPGSRLVQTEIANQLGISVTPVREAMRDLVSEGLILVDPHKAARVRELDIDDAIEINVIRHELEPLAAALASRNATPVELETISALNIATQKAETDASWLETNRLYHLAIIEASHSARLLQVLGNLREISDFYLGALVRNADESFRKKSLCEHHQLTDAIRNKDETEASRIMRNHLATHEDMRASLVRGIPVDEVLGADTGK